jgi:hypothetical protein
LGRERHDTTASFTTGASWSTYDLDTLAAGTKGFFGTAFDGRYVYFVPDYDVGPFGRVVRYDTTAPFGASASWSTFDVATVSENAKGFQGAAFDGQYVYFLPGETSFLARYNTHAPFNVGTSWEAFDVGALSATGFRGATFDGRYVYLAPRSSASPGHGVLARYDTTAPFASASSWSTFDTTRANANATAFQGAVFDGRYVYLVPDNGSVAARFDAKTPPALPPGYGSSFF